MEARHLSDVGLLLRFFVREALFCPVRTESDFFGNLRARRNDATSAGQSPIFTSQGFPRNMAEKTSDEVSGYRIWK